MIYSTRFKELYKEIDSLNIDSNKKNNIKQGISDIFNHVKISRVLLLIVILALFCFSFFMFSNFLKDVFINELDLIRNKLLDPKDRAINSDVIMALIAGTVTQTAVSFVIVSKFFFKNHSFDKNNFESLNNNNKENID